MSGSKRANTVVVVKQLAISVHFHGHLSSVNKLFSTLICMAFEEIAVVVDLAQ